MVSVYVDMGSTDLCFDAIALSECVCSKAAADAAVLPYLRIIMELVKRQFHMATLMYLRVFDLKFNFLLPTLYIKIGLCN